MCFCSPRPIPHSSGPFGFMGGPCGYTPRSHPTLCSKDPQPLSMSPVCLSLEFQRACLPGRESPNSGVTVSRSPLPLWVSGTFFQQIGRGSG